MGDNVMNDEMDYQEPEEGTTPVEADGLSEAADDANVDVDVDSNTEENSEPVVTTDALIEANEKVLRIQAELDNFRKRARRELDDSLKYAQLPLARDLLMVLDNLNLALNAAADNEAASSLAEGVKMVADQLINALNNHQVYAIESVGHPFDPNQHEAIQMESSEEYDANTVSREVRSGYRLHDRVIRPAQVFVSTGPATAE